MGKIAEALGVPTVIGHWDASLVSDLPSTMVPWMA